MVPNITIRQHEAFVQTARRVAKSTCQLYLYREDRFDTPRPHGCCVLFRFNDKFYCFSNAHVLGDQYMEQAFVLTNRNQLNGKSRTTTIGGQYYFTKLPSSGKREDDTIDMAIVQLTQECADDLIERGYLFIGVNDIQTNYKPKADDKLLIAGYPGSGTKVNTYLRNVIAKPFYLLTSPYLEDLRHMDFPIEFHTTARYAKGKIFNPKSGEINKGPMPHGVSGSGLWQITKNENGDQQALLVGILSTYLQNRSLVISTKVDLFIDLMNQVFKIAIPNNGNGIKLLD